MAAAFLAGYQYLPVLSNTTHHPEEPCVRLYTTLVIAMILDTLKSVCTIHPLPSSNQSLTTLDTFSKQHIHKGGNTARITSGSLGVVGSIRSNHNVTPG